MEDHTGRIPVIDDALDGWQQLLRKGQRTRNGKYSVNGILSVSCALPLSKQLLPTVERIVNYRNAAGVIFHSPVSPSRVWRDRPVRGRARMWLSGAAHDRRAARGFTMALSPRAFSPPPKAAGSAGARRAR